MGVVPGNRVLLRAANKPMLVACWFAVMKAGAIAVATMPMLRAKELKQIVDKGEVGFALCDQALRAELDDVARVAPMLERVVCFGDPSRDGLEALMARHDAPFTNVDTAADDTCMFAFTSGTTGQPKATMHFHRDVMASCMCFPPHVLRAEADDVFIGSPPLAFTFGLGGLTVFPMHIGASTVLLEKAGPPDLLAAIVAHRATVCFTAPTSYRAMAAGAKEKKIGVRDGGAAAQMRGRRRGAARRHARALERGHRHRDHRRHRRHRDVPHLHLRRRGARAARRHRQGGARLSRQGGRRRRPRAAARHRSASSRCKAPPAAATSTTSARRNYVKGGWNYTGDAYLMDADGYFHYQSRTDDMIISAGYNIAAVEVEDVLLRHEAVAECAVIGHPDEERGQIVKAFVVLRASHRGDEAMVKALQDYVKASVAPYKYPRAVEFREALPRTETGKLQRFRLRG